MYKPIIDKIIIDKITHIYNSKNKNTMIGFGSTFVLLYYLINQMMGVIQIVCDVSVFALMIAKLFITIFSNSDKNLKHQLETNESNNIKNLKSLHRSHRLTQRAKNEYMESLLKQIFIVFALRSTIFALPIISIFAVVPFMGIILTSIHFILLSLMILVQVPVPAINIMIDNVKQELNIANFNFSFTKPLSDTIISLLKSLLSIETKLSIETIQDNVMLIESKTKLSKKDTDSMLKLFDQFNDKQKEQKLHP
jgi:hypothetical protein